MKVIKYQKENKKDWDNFVDGAKNKHFFFYRNYMEYHSDRFDDHSLLIYNDKGDLISLLPANEKDSILYTHQGLTFGGFIINEKMKTEPMLKIFDELKSHLKKENFSKIIYKCIPHIYHNLPSEEDLYCLFRNDAKLIKRDISTTIDLENKVKFQEQRKRAIKKGIKYGLKVEKPQSFEGYWELLSNVLESQHNTTPVHKVEEIASLSKSFPENIHLYVAKKDNQILGGTLIFENGPTVHTQYLANSYEGKEVGALDLTIDYLINNTYKHKKYFDFGISTENNGLCLNLGLISQKEGFGGRGICYDTYEVTL
ncbi:MAG: GNAT family N-acetyltransferase [Candidatus Caenarcaniphilales bacterium]|nr:GNAT family N-acetyltransferase [Candidatus Caenarcaniphilales bacterium]